MPSSSGTKPPSGLSPDEEVAWWKKKIAVLSGDPRAESKENTAANVTSFNSESKSDSKNTSDFKSDSRSFRK